VKRQLDGGIELDDDKTRVDRAEVHRFLSEESYWAKGRPREVLDRLVDDASRVVGLYDQDRQIGFCRAFTDGVTIAYLADVYVLEEYRGRGLGEAMVREMVDGIVGVRWYLHTSDMHSLYRKLGFGAPGPKAMERERRQPGS
jgi:GNAT superfamily N-acetyltransferase